VGAEVGGHAIQKSRVVIEQACNPVAAIAQQATDCTGIMTMIDGESLYTASAAVFGCLLSATSRTDAALSGNHACVGFIINAEPLPSLLVPFIGPRLIVVLAHIRPPMFPAAIAPSTDSTNTDMKRPVGFRELDPAIHTMRNGLASPNLTTSGPVLLVFSLPPCCAGLTV
jgi:hypothetical protein